MKQSKKELDAIIDAAARGISEERIDAAAIDESSARVWAQISRRMTGAENAAISAGHNGEIETMNANTEQIHGCDDFQSLIPAYLEGSLSPARTLLLKDHSNECIPCRRALKNQRAAAGIASPSAAGVPAKAAPVWRRPAFVRAARWSIAATVLVGLAFSGMFLFDRLDLSGRTMAATLDNAEGEVFVVSDAGNRRLTVGEELRKGESVRTAKGSTAVLRLADGSTVEMRERSEFSVSENRRGVTISLARGDVIVEAAKQKNGRLYVRTPDSLVSVKGTIFAVDSGVKGSRVSVVEGEVEVEHSGKSETLNPGDQTTTGATLAKTSVKEDVAWSRNAARYNLVAELAALSREVNQKVALPGVRYESRFLDLVPENTVFYAALPNLGESLAESERIVEERIAQNPALAEWWKGNRGGETGGGDKAFARVREFSSYLGDEIVVSGGLDAAGKPSGLLVLGAVRDAARLRAFVESQAAELAAAEKKAPKFRLVDDPLNFTAAATSKDAPGELYVWIGGDVFAASPEASTLRGFAARAAAPAAGGGFAATPFRARIAETYQNGASIVVAADLEKILADGAGKDARPAKSGDERRSAGLRKLGVTALRDFVAEQKTVDGRTLSRAALTFAEPGTGIASWLAAPGPMGSLDFVSPNANVAAAFVVKKPELLVDDLFSMLETVDPTLRQQIRELELSQGFDIRADFAAPLGGEFAFAVDGPILPTPSWKMILEVYDQPKLQDSFERLVARLNQLSAIAGKGRLTIEKTEIGGLAYYAVKSSATSFEFNYVYANGYLVAAPSRALLEQAVAGRASGSTLVRSSRFMSALPADGNANFSALLYHDLAPLMGTFADRLRGVGGELSEKDRATLGSFDSNAPPTLVYAIAEDGRITFSANTEGGAFGLSPASLIGLPNSFEMQHILTNAMGEKNVD